MESTKSPSVELLGQQQPRLKVTPTAAAHDAADVIEMLACYGLVLDPWRAAPIGQRMSDRGAGTQWCDVVRGAHSRGVGARSPHHPAVV